MTIKRRRGLKHAQSFEERLSDEAQRFREAAALEAPGMARELLLRRARLAESARAMSVWLRPDRAAAK
mgnify:CR=1 FL=1